MKKNQNQLYHHKYRPDIDGLRAVAVLAVVIFHAFPSSLQGGFIGVDIFFVISGFLISTIIYNSLQKGDFSFADFYSRRIRRIFPALLVVISATFIFGFLILSADEFSRLGRLVAAGIGFVANLVLWSESGYFDAATATKPLLHLWSLGIEEQFYIVWPLILLFAWKRRFNLLLVTVIVLTLSFMFNIMQIRSDPVATFYSPLTRIWEILFGSLLAWIMVFRREAFYQFNLKADGYLSSLNFISKTSGKHLFANLISTSGAILFLVGLFVITEESYFPGFWALVPALGTVMMIMAGTEAWINKNILSNKVAVWFGLISYPLYLWHWPLLSYGRIYYDKAPPTGFRWIAVLLAILLAWLTVKYIEKPLRYSKRKTRSKVIYLSSIAVVIAAIGLFVSVTDFSKSNTFKEFSITRKGFEYAYGPSLNWYQGQDNWLYLGNSYDKGVEKLQLVEPPKAEKTDGVADNMAAIVSAADKTGTKVAFIMGPNKSSIYPEFLPEALVPSETKYSSFFLDKLKIIPNLVVYDPTADLLKAKEKEGLLYWKTDTHWNDKGAFIAYSGLAEALSLPTPQVTFTPGDVHEGDLIGISKLEDFPLDASDSWRVDWQEQPISQEQEVPNEHDSPFGNPTIVTTQNALTDKYVWVVGDSFSQSLKPYLNATFKEVYYVGHWSEKLEDLAKELNKVSRKPDIIIIERVERSF
ncbi:acyltransferase family protein [Psychrobacter jeotgali]|uniref:acyltransferase family protein n=1 Tax=Psychrobacter jeotgali TaxID=179010 RepID=UPI00191AB306|nr:acyltransferase family protein [Psychrobacter jeotgali]